MVEWMGGWVDGWRWFLLYCESSPRVSVTAGSVSVFIESRSNPGCSPRAGRSAASCLSYYLPHYTSGRRRFAPIVAAVIRSDQNGAFQTMTMNFF